MLDIDKQPIWWENCDRCRLIWLEAAQFNLANINKILPQKFL
ncbi:hypothetical protein [Microcystis aeruginosa]|nr:hypothetical protein [Microcystis aeruginosa]